jgi:ubiquinone/menaquinone biosynthesis C-methylase UbiE
MILPSGESFEAFRKRNINWWLRHGSYSDNPNVRKPYWDKFLLSNNINFTHYEGMIIGEICCGAYGGMLNNFYDIPAKEKVLIDIFINDFVTEGLLNSNFNFTLVNSPAEKIDLIDNYCDLLLGINSLDHGWDIYESLRECYRVSKECFLKFDCRYTPGAKWLLTKNFKDLDHFQEVDYNQIERFLYSTFNNYTIIKQESEYFPAANIHLWK